MKNLLAICAVCLFIGLSYGQTKQNTNEQKTDVLTSYQKYFTATPLDYDIYVADPYVSSEPVSSQDQDFPVAQKTLLLELPIDSYADT